MRIDKKNNYKYLICDSNDESISPLPLYFFIEGANRDIILDFLSSGFLWAVRNRRIYPYIETASMILNFLLKNKIMNVLVLCDQHAIQMIEINTQNKTKTINLKTKIRPY
jgi:hypothetical protein